MEATGVLDPCDGFDLFVLHSIFLPRIKKSLTQHITLLWKIVGIDDMKMAHSVECKVHMKL